MAAAVVTKSTTLENQLLEIVELIAIKQGDPATNPDAVNFITSYNRNNLTGQFTVALSFPSSDVIDATDGSIDVLADAVYL
ncbi:MAG TPA: hypothetical protein V6D21_03080 [Candidatus Obscuribacterales bacterium]